MAVRRRRTCARACPAHLPRRPTPRAAPAAPLPRAHARPQTPAVTPPWQGQPPPRQAMADLPSGRRRLNWGGDRRPLDSLLTISVLAPIERAAAATQRDDLPDDSRVG
eukprot:scaffold14619_cov66-Phaeocystis_antarctica.AAC.3